MNCEICQIFNVFTWNWGCEILNVFTWKWVVKFVKRFNVFFWKWVTKFVKFWMFLPGIGLWNLSNFECYFLEMGCEICQIMDVLPGSRSWNFECFYLEVGYEINFECFFIPKWIVKFVKFLMFLPGSGLWNLSNFECFIWKWVVKFWMFLPANWLWNFECFYLEVG